jgi:MFS family permease
MSTATLSEGQRRTAPPRRETIGLGILFGVLYFVQGVGDPTDGLISQPVMSLLKSWELGDAKITWFVALLSLPWTIKPIYGLLTDFLPLAGYRRKSYLLLTSGAASAGMAVLAFLDLSGVTFWLLFSLLVVPTVGVAFADVVVDALMVEKGQPRGITGVLQSVQWGAMYAATVLTGFLGGYFSEEGRQPWAFAVCAAVSLASFVLTWFYVKEPPSRMRPGAMRRAAVTLWRSARSPAVLSVGSFLFLWNFNPFSTSVLNLYVTKHLGFSEQFYGNMTSVLAAASIAACVAYGFYCRRVPFGLLVHASIALGILATIAYWAMWNKTSMVIVTVAVGFTYMTANLVLMDLAARICPVENAGTMFALLMAIQNIGLTASTAVGGQFYEAGQQWWGARTSFNVLVGIGAATTACCWLLVPWLRRQAGVGGASTT